MILMFTYFPFPLLIERMFVMRNDWLCYEEEDDVCRENEKKSLWTSHLVVAKGANQGQKEIQTLFPTLNPVIS